MNKISILKNIISKSKVFLKSIHQENHKWKNIFDLKSTKPKIVVIGTSILTMGLVVYSVQNQFDINNLIFNKLENKLESENIVAPIIKTENNVITDVKEEIEIKDEIISQDTSNSIIYMNDSSDTIVNGIPTEVPYLIIGGGISGMSAARTIRANDPLAKVLIINHECQSPGVHNENYPPYRRILLSKYIWRRTEENQKTLLDSSGDAKQSSFLFVEPDSFFIEPEKLNRCEFGGISLLNGHKVIQIDPNNFTVTLENGDHQIKYKACLIATGSIPKRIRHLEISDNANNNLYNNGQVSYFRSLNDFRNLFEKIKTLRNNEKPGKIMIIGAGLLGTELTSSLGRVAKDQGNLEVIEVFKEKSHLYKILPEQLSNYIFKHISKNQTKLISESEVVSISEINDGPESGRLTVTIKSLVNGSNEEVVEHVDHVIIAAGVEPETSLSEYAKLEIDKELGGFLVNAELQSREGIYVAGDSCSFYDTLLGRRRVEHWNHSEESGNVAGHNMAAYVLKTIKDSKHFVDNSRVAYDVLKPRIYDYQSSFSFKLNVYNSIEAMGMIDSKLDTRTFIATDFYDGQLDALEEDQSAVDETTIQPMKTHDPLDMPGVVFYLKNKTIVGILLWNCDDDILVETDFPSPLRTNIARKILMDQHRIQHNDNSNDDDLMKLAADFDLSFYVNSQIKFLDEYTKKRKQEEQESKIDKDVELVS